MSVFQTSKRLEVISSSDRYLISNNKNIVFQIIHNEHLSKSVNFHLVMAKYIEGNFSVEVENAFLQTFSGNYFFFLYANNDYTEYILNFLSSNYVLDHPNIYLKAP